MTDAAQAVSFSITTDTPDRAEAVISISHPTVQSVYQAVVKTQQSDLHTQGFVKGNTPRTFIESSYQPTILEHVRELFFNHVVVDYLYKQLAEHKCVVAGEPTLIDIKIEPDGGARFTFELTRINPSIDNSWRRLPFKAPQRKNYKDLDRQVELFVREEIEKQKIAGTGIEVNDWIGFTIEIINAEGSELLQGLREAVFLRIGDEEGDREARGLFVGKKVGDSFITASNLLQEYISKDLDARYSFRVSITDRVPVAYFSLDLFKHQFGLRSPRDIHGKLIEVFSFRNDMSQRRETAEAALRILVKTYACEPPQPLMQRQMQKVYAAVHENPDYQVYKAQQDFHMAVKLLAQKQLKETLIIDHLAEHEEIVASNTDILAYLNLTLRPRTKDFIYFELPSTKNHGQESPIPREFVRRHVRREKTLNTIIATLAK